VAAKVFLKLLGLKMEKETLLVSGIIESFSRELAERVGFEPTSPLISTIKLIPYSSQKVKT